MQEIITQVSEWSVLQKLPADICGFRLVIELQECEGQYRIFTYDNPVRRRIFTVVYDSVTKEFLARVTIGLIEFCDISFIVGDLKALQRVLSDRMEKTLISLGRFDVNSLDSIFIEKKIIEWAEKLQLPHTIAGFDLNITPMEPVKIINGSYIVLDYSDFSTESNLIIYYNIYRDEFFGEVRIKRTPQMAADFDVKTLPELQEKLTMHLKPTLEKMRNKLTG